MCIRDRPTVDAIAREAASREARPGKRFAAGLKMCVDGLEIVEKNHMSPTLTSENFPCAPVSYTHLRAHETKANLVCRLLLEKKQKTTPKSSWARFCYTNIPEDSRKN